MNNKNFGIDPNCELTTTAWCAVLCSMWSHIAVHQREYSWMVIDKALQEYWSVGWMLMENIDGLPQRNTSLNKDIMFYRLLKTSTHSNW